ncbi:DUF177 domain-containing protein [Aquicoccus sp. G2-2]|uniref:YceD family protein n=1 Tax=Aquicoccus sp. G2-2 TaxID=3092120 RepID=UPI002ADF4E5E|nr:YceD family protein [Aquicoccus sp. G2-2]MEA1113372.1 YceD family protein [Aquicoccus sp. G2-2]
MAAPLSPTRFRVVDLPQNRPVTFQLVPDSETLTALAADLGLLDLRKLSFSGELSAVGQTDWRLTAKLSATVVQSCVVTLSPVSTRIEEPVSRRFLSQLPEDASDETEIELPEDENIEKLGPEIDLTAVMAEALALALPLYPRAQNAALDDAVFTEPGKLALSDADLRPFASLKALRDKLENDD